MFRIVNDAFQDSEELHSLAAYCLTETIKRELESYFEDGYKKATDELLYKEVKMPYVIQLFPTEFLKEMEIVGVNVDVFIPKKFSQFMKILAIHEEVTPDIFIEYILSRMIYKYTKENRFEIIPEDVSCKIDDLKKLLRTYAKDTLQINDIKERNLYVKENTLVLTRFSYLPGVEGYDDTSLAFWDWDFSFFDDWGFIKTLEQLSFGVLNQSRGEYGLDYSRNIFLSVGEQEPSILV